jgi:dipeptidyl aminopeptidase/acylaminoacyl peptidase
MKTTLTVAAFGLSLGALFATSRLTAQTADLRAEYARAASLRERLQNKIYDVIDTPTWIEGSAKFWYRKSVKGGNQFVLVDPGTATKAPAFDHARLAAALSTASGASYTALALPFTTITFVNNLDAIEFDVTSGLVVGRGGAGRGGIPATGQDAVPGVPRWRCTLADDHCIRIPAPAASPVPAPGRNGADGSDTQDAPAVRRSPDGKTEAYVQNYNVYLRPAGGRLEDGAPLSWDGSEGNAYVANSIAWAPDSKKLAAYRRLPGYQRMLSYVQSSPPDQLQPKVSTRLYRKPGDVVDVDQPVLFNVEKKQQVIVEKALFDNPFDISRVQWRKDSRAFTFLYNQRGHQLLRLVEVDALTGRARTVVEETSKTFVDYRPTNASSTDSGRRYRYDVADGKEVIWMSERDGWAHLYLFDGVTGALKNQITKGPFVVRGVDRVDEEKRQIWFSAGGVHANQDPYFLQFYRVNFDGTGLTPLTDDDGNHALTWSPDHQFYVDIWSRVDLPPVAQLRRASDPKVVMDLEKADITDLLATGWRAPEVFTAKGRDGQTDIWGVIVRPTNFDPAVKYPVVENIYAGPQGSFVPKTFGTQIGMQTLADVGFIVVQIDGMGTANRSKAFHDVAWKNLGDAGFPDRIAWHQAVGRKYWYYDLSRVGIYGTSAGGQSAMGAVLFHPEFYKAAAASAGCHDNRMDKIWWNEQWMGWPVGPEYAAASNMENAAKLQGALLLIVGEMDTNVDPSSTMQVVNRLILANKNFDLLVIPNAGHTNGGTYGDRKRFDFFVRQLRGLEPPSWNLPVNLSFGGPGALDEEAVQWEASEDAGFVTFPEAGIQ